MVRLMCSNNLPLDPSDRYNYLKDYHRSKFMRTLVFPSNTNVKFLLAVVGMICIQFVIFGFMVFETTICIKCPLSNLYRSGKSQYPWMITQTLRCTHASLHAHAFTGQSRSTRYDSARQCPVIRSATRAHWFTVRSSDPAHNNNHNSAITFVKSSPMASVLSVS